MLSLIIHITNRIQKQILNSFLIQSLQSFVTKIFSSVIEAIDALISVILGWFIRIICGSAPASNHRNPRTRCNKRHHRKRNNLKQYKSGSSNLTTNISTAYGFSGQNDHLAQREERYQSDLDLDLERLDEAQNLDFDKFHERSSSSYSENSEDVEEYFRNYN